MIPHVMELMTGKLLFISILALSLEPKSVVPSFLLLFLALPELSAFPFQGLLTRWADSRYCPYNCHCQLGSIGHFYLHHSHSSYIFTAHGWLTPRGRGCSECGWCWSTGEISPESSLLTLKSLSLITQFSISVTIMLIQILFCLLTTSALCDISWSDNI